jgi:hypothetical protein
MEQIEANQRKGKKPTFSHFNQRIYDVDNKFRLAKYDIIITTYGTVMSEMKGVLAKTKESK